MIYGLSCLTIFGSWVRWFDNIFHKWPSPEWKLFANHLTSDQKLIIHDNPYIISFLTCLSGAKRKVDENSHWLIPMPLLFTVDQSFVALWRRVNTYCGIILTDCHGWGQSWKSQSGCNSTHIPFIPSQSTLPFLKYKNFINLTFENPRWRWNDVAQVQV